MNSIRVLFLLGAALLIIGSLSVSGHSCLRCAKWNPDTGECLAGPRNEGNLFEEEAYLWASGTPICQSTWANPISSYYSNGSSCPFYAECPDPMGTYTPGETFTIMWWARNHAIADEDPDTIYLYLSPIETENQGSDVSEAVFEENLICSAPYMSCGGLNGNTVNCSTECTMPSNLASGVYTMLWMWPWQGVIYTTCTDIIVSGSSSPSSVTTGKAHVSVTTGHAAVTTDKVVASPVTTGKATKVTTGKEATKVTTGKASKATTSRVISPTSTSSSTSTSTSSSSTSTSTGQATGSCTLGEMQCLTENTYQSCGNGVSGPAWSVSQSCQTGLSCHQTGIYVYCY